MTIAVVISDFDKVQQQLAEVSELKQKIEAQRDDAADKRRKAIVAGDHEQARDCLRKQKAATDELELLADREKHLRDVALPAAEKADAAAKLPALIAEYERLLAKQPKLDQTATVKRDEFLTAAQQARANHDRASELWHAINGSSSSTAIIPPLPDFDRSAYQAVGFELNPILTY